MTETYNDNTPHFDRLSVIPEQIAPDMGAIAFGTGLTSAVEQLPSPQEASLLMESRGFARLAPKFSQLVGDKGRDNTFRHYAYDTTPSGEATEQEGLEDLSDFLSSASGPLATSMLENLTFIGEKEYAEGVAGLAAYWKRFLDSDPEAQICAIAPISSHGAVKSDAYLRDRILSHFSDDELVKYKGRLVVDSYLLSAPANKVRVALIDDWVISGSQMSHGYHNLMASLDPTYRKSVELNLLVGSSKRLREGFAGVTGDFKGVPVKAYFLAHDANGPVGHVENGAYISGTHSSVDFDFQDPISLLTSNNPHNIPKLALVERTYGVCTQAERLRQIYYQSAS